MKKISNRELARRAGFSEAHISRVRRGHVVPSIACALKLSASLGIGINELLVRIKQGRWD